MVAEPIPYTGGESYTSFTSCGLTLNRLFQRIRHPALAQLSGLRSCAVGARKSFIAFAAGAAGVALLLGASMVPAIVPAAPLADRSVHFTAAGDFGAGTNTAAVLNKNAALAPDFSLALGDLSYGATGAEQAWCDLVLDHMGAGFAFELLAGNHESSGQNGNINDFAACLPNQLPGVVGIYGRQWYVDVPQSNPLMRVVMISPGLSFTGSGYWDYDAGTSRYAWTEAAIDSARAAEIPWVVVGAHLPCLSLGDYDCGSGADLLNLLVTKKVDLVLNGHEHLYQRTHQLSLGPECTLLAPGTAAPGCIADTDNDLTKSAGTIFATVGTGGTGLRDVYTNDPELPYFAAYAGRNLSPAHGLLDVTVTPEAMTAAFAPASSESFSDSFTLTKAAPATNADPIAAFAVSCDGLTCAFDGQQSSDPDGSLVSYSWDFGDGEAATGGMAEHSYATAGGFTVTLTVTDDGGAAASSAHSVTVQTPADIEELLHDSFDRLIDPGWGSTALGGEWRPNGSQEPLSVSDGSGHIEMATSGSGSSIYLTPATSDNLDLTTEFTVDKRPTGSILYWRTIGRRTAAGEYRSELQIRPTGQLRLSLARATANNAQTSIEGNLIIPELVFENGDSLMLRTQMIGTNPTILRAKVWAAGTPEPTGWHLEATDATAGLQAEGGIGYYSYLSRSVTNAPIVISVKDVLGTLP